MDRLSDIGAREETRDRFYGTIWLHYNIPGDRDRISGLPPYLLRQSHEIIVCPDGDPNARLPVLGLPVITDNKLILNVNGARRHVNLRTQFRLWPIGAD
jgi:hypothetical protein